MRPTAPILTLLILALVVGAVAALAARAGLSRDPRADELVEISLDRLQHTITLPPDHNARITSYVDPVLHLRRRNEAETRRRLDFNRPKLQDSLQSALSRFHVTQLQDDSARSELAREMRDAVNGVLGGDYVEAVSAHMSSSR
ncbi:MAG: flagellar basal body-associated FliL family protein [Planctomycetota bacterium]